MTRELSGTSMVSSVMVDGANVPMGGEYTVDDARAMLIDNGIMKNINNATAVEVTPGVVEFRVTRGDNG